MKYIKLYENRRDFVFDEQRYFPNTALVNGEEEPSYFTDVEEVVFELTVTLPTEKVVTGQTYTLAVEYGGADVFSEATVTTTGDVTLNGTQFTANSDGDFSVTATYDGKTVTLNGTSKLMTAAPRTGINDTGCGIYKINIYGNAPKRITFNGEEFTPSQQEIFNYKVFYADLTEQTVFVTATAQEEGKWESDVATATYTIPVLQTLTASISDDTLEDGQTAQITVKYGNQNVTEDIGIMYTASGDVTCSNGDGIFHKGAGVVTATYSTGSGSIVVSHNGRLGNPNLTPITINVTVAQPQVATNIVFADNDVKAIVTNAYGTDGEITEEQAAAVTTWFEGGYNNTSTNPFCKNANVDSFDEFAYFTGVTEIGEDAFQECSNMQSITLPSSLTYIPDYAFTGCSSLGSVTIPAAVTYIGYRAFRYCNSLESITIGAGVSSMSTNVFDGCGDLTYISVDSSNSYFNDGNGSNAIIDGSGNLLYGGGACTVIPNTAYTIGQSAFSGRHLLNNTITIPSSVTSIGASVFYNCDELTSITIPNSVTSIGNSAFKGCDGLTSVTIGNSVASIGGAAFQNCSALTSVTIPSSVTEIYNDAFNGCTSLSFIIFDGDRPTKLGARAFTNTNDCPIYVPAAYVNNWSVYTERIQAIENIVFADNDVKSILANAFGSNGEITNAQAAAVTTWFSGADSSTNPFYDNANVDSFDEFSYFTGVTEIGNNAFGFCSNLQSVTIPASVTSIGASAFSDCEKLASVTIPNSVTSIGNYAFYDLYKIQSIICEATTPPTLGDYVFDSTNDCYIYVPAASVDTFKTAWSDYADRIRAFGVYVSLSAESIVTGETYTLKVTHNGLDVLSNATVTSTGDVTISGSSFTANSDGAFSITATYNGYTATLNGTASQSEPTPEYTVVALDCSELEDANPFEDYNNEAQSNAEYLGLIFGHDTYVENGVITIPPEDDFGAIELSLPYPAYDGCIGYIKLTHPSAEYKLNEETTSSVGEGAGYTCDVSFNSTTLTTTLSNFVSEDQELPFTGTLALTNVGSTDIKITRIEVAFIPAEEEPAEEEPAEEEPAE